MAQRFAIYPGQLPELRDINDAFARFAFIQERVGHAHTQRDVPLCEAGL